jgi:hypothetical protein
VGGRRGLVRSEDWTEVTLNTQARGSSCGSTWPAPRCSSSWIEVTFANGEAQVIDFAEEVARSPAPTRCSFPERRTVVTSAWSRAK